MELALVDTCGLELHILLIWGNSEFTHWESAIGMFVTLLSLVFQPTVGGPLVSISVDECNHPFQNEEAILLRVIPTTSRTRLNLHPSYRISIERGTFLPPPPPHGTEGSAAANWITEDRNVISRSLACHRPSTRGGRRRQQIAKILTRFVIIQLPPGAYVSSFTRALISNTPGTCSAGHSGHCAVSDVTFPGGAVYLNLDRGEVESGTFFDRLMTQFVQLFGVVFDTNIFHYAVIVLSDEMK